jgi:hypothetical protein
VAIARSDPQDQSGEQPATDRVFIYDDGSVTDENGERLGNIHDEI